ncbi:mechanosensitive ion channel domain-containing protein [uncultured Jannaschia sp.]|uniref:mechanosensitive ion channel family protein n=1 Tax=uncultured Jannaschia sp. TaxID=293347 RepID=UPI002633E9E8|nr:mechanosensitive ion channel domain-containing protein [uncultured Jannaschia sp.]
MHRLHRLFAPFLILVVLLATPARAEDPWYMVDTLNPGLGTVPADVDRRTPRAAISTFLVAAEEGDWARAAHVLDLSDLPEAEQRAQSEILARQLHSVLDRKAVFDWSAINDRPDALQTVGGQSQAQAGEPRRSLLIRELALDPVPATIRLERVKAGEDAAPVWVFSRETTADLPALYAAYGPSPLEARLPDDLRDDAFWGLMWWELIGLPLLLGAAILLGRIVHAGLTLAARYADGDLGQRVFKAISTPLIIASVTTLVWWVTDTVFVFSGAIDIWLAPLIAAGFVTATLLLIVNVIEAILEHLIAPGDDIDLTSAHRDKAREMATKLNAAKRILVIVVTLVGVGIVLSTADAFRSLGLSLLASAGALTLILGFAARNVLGNIMASLQIAMNQSARVGDRIVFKGELCHVERIHMTFVQLKDWDGTRVVVPVEEFVSETFSNWTLGEPDMLRILKLKLAHTADVQAVREAFLDVLQAVKDDTDLTDDLGEIDEAGVNVAGQDVFGMDVWFSVPCTDPNTSWEVACTVRERLLAAITEMQRNGDEQLFPEAQAAEAA